MISPLNEGPIRPVSSPVSGPVCDAPADAAEMARLLPAVEALARAAGAVILEVYASDFDVSAKADTSPVTVADERAEALITPALQALTPNWPIVAEEAAARGQAPAAARTFWLVDPLDGTREFVQRNGQFTVNIALVHDGAPVLGVVLQPVGDVLYAGIVGQGAWCDRAGQRGALQVGPVPAAGWRLAASRSHGDEAALQAWLQTGLGSVAGGLPVAGRVNAGSSLKFGLLACGEADVYPRLGRTMEWDTAAGHAVLAAAGGRVCTLDGASLRYGKPGYENPHFVAWAGTGPS
jgi:3'(2'), 5'-bisphosphate nucleotidase